MCVGLYMYCILCDLHSAHSGVIFIFIFTFLYLSTTTLQHITNKNKKDKKEREKAFHSVFLNYRVCLIVQNLCRSRLKIQPVQKFTLCKHAHMLIDDVSAYCPLEALIHCLLNFSNQ